MKTSGKNELFKYNKRFPTLMKLTEVLNEYFDERGQVLMDNIKEKCKQDLTNLFESVIEYYTPKRINPLNILKIRKKKAEQKFEIIKYKGNEYLRVHTQINSLDKLLQEKSDDNLLENIKSKIKIVKSTYVTQLTYCFESWLNSLQPSEVGSIDMREQKKIGSNIEQPESAIQITNAERFLGFDDLKINDKYIQVVVAQGFDIDLLKRFKEKLINYLKTI